MPIEYTLLKNYPYAREKCPQCGEPFPEFMRGLIQSWWRKILKLPYCAVICHNCKEIIGWERPFIAPVHGRARGGDRMMIAWWWLIVVFILGVGVGWIAFSLVMCRPSCPLAHDF